MNKKEFREAQKRLVVIRDHEKEINARFSIIKSAIEKEKRKMNDTEAEEFRNLSEEIILLSLYSSIKYNKNH